MCKAFKMQSVTGEVVRIRQGEHAPEFLDRQVAAQEQSEDLRADGMQMRRQAGEDAGQHVPTI